MGGTGGRGRGVATRAISWRARLGRMGWTTARARPPRRRLPERPPAQQDVEDRAKPPNTVHHPPGDLPARAEIGAARTIDLGQHHRNRVQDDGHDDLHQQFHHARSLSLIHHTLPGGHPTGACGARAPGGPRDRPCPRRWGAGAASPPPSRAPHAPHAGRTSAASASGTIMIPPSPSRRTCAASNVGTRCRSLSSRGAASV